jgi:hypothetical protein
MTGFCLYFFVSTPIKAILFSLSLVLCSLSTSNSPHFEQQMNRPSQICVIIPIIPKIPDLQAAESDQISANPVQVEQPSELLICAMSCARIHLAKAVQSFPLTP